MIMYSSLYSSRMTAIKNVHVSFLAYMPVSCISRILCVIVHDAMCRAEAFANVAAAYTLSGLTLFRHFKMLPSLHTCRLYTEFLILVVILFSSSSAADETETMIILCVIMHPCNLCIIMFSGTVFSRQHRLGSR